MKINNKTKNKTIIGAIAATITLTSSGALVMANNETGKKIPTDADTIPEYAKETILDMYDRGRLAGFTDGTFRPHQELSRVEFVAMLLGAYNFEANNAKKARIDDGLIVFLNEDKMSDWEKSVIREAYSKNLINGVSEKDELDEMGRTIKVVDPNSFGKITREEMAAMFERAMNNSLLTTKISDEEVQRILGELSDSEQVSDWAKNSIATVKSTGLFNGTSDTTFSPKKIGTRVEAALLSNRLEAANKSKETSVPVSLEIAKGLGLDEVNTFLENSSEFKNYQDSIILVNPLPENEDAIAKTGWSSAGLDTFMFTYLDKDGVLRWTHYQKATNSKKTVKEIYEHLEEFATVLSATEITVYSRLQNSTASKDNTELLTNENTVVFLSGSNNKVLNSFKVTIK